MPLPDYLVPLDEDTLRERMLGRLPTTLDKSEGSFLWDAIAPAAIELTIADDRLRTIMDWVFSDMTFGEYLDRKAAEWGIVRKVASAATATIRITGTNGTVVGAGSVFSTAATPDTPAQTFTSTAPGTIAGGVVDVPVEADVDGAAGNVGADTITFLLTAIAGVTSVTNPVAAAGGSDDETDLELHDRLEQRVQSPSSSGNQADYRRWALEVAGVGQAAVVPLELGPGTVTVALLDTNGDPAAAGLITAVKNYIDPTSGGGDGVAPIGAAVTVEAATVISIDITADITPLAGYVEADVRAAAEARLATYLKSLDFKTDNDVRVARIITTILDTDGVADVTTVTVEGDTVNITMTPKQVARLGTVVWS